MTTLQADDIAAILRRYFVDGDRSSDIVLRDIPPADVPPNIVDDLLSRPNLHDEDFRVFGHFKDRYTTILDVGANFGYSATSIWRSGSQAAVASFEPIPTYAPILQALGERVNPRNSGLFRRWRSPKRHEAFAAGVSDRPGSIEFHMSVLNGHRIISALTTASNSPYIDGYVRNTMIFAEACNIEISSFRIHAFTAPVVSIDQWLASGVATIPTRRIVAMKIDTEGYEGEVLVGASGLLHHQRPLIMAEGGHRIPLAVDTMRQHGYVMMERTGDKLVPTGEPAQGINGFFGHPALFPHYREIGLM